MTDIHTYDTYVIYFHVILTCSEPTKHMLTFVQLLGSGLPAALASLQHLSTPPTSPRPVRPGQPQVVAYRLDPQMPRSRIMQ